MANYYNRGIVPSNPQGLSGFLRKELEKIQTAFGSISAAWASITGKPANVTALGALVGAADQVPYFTGVGAMALASLTPYARTIIACANAAAARTVLGLGALAVLDAVTESTIVLADNTTDNVSPLKHGFAPKAPNDATKYLDGSGAYSVPAGSGSSPPAFPTIAGAMFGWDSILSQTDLTPLGYAKKMYDISGNGRHSDVNTTNPPKWAQRGFNRGYPAIYFNGSTKMTISALPGLGSPLACTIVFVVQDCLPTGGNSHIYNWSGNPIGFGGNTSTPLDFMFNGTLPAAHPMSAESKLFLPPDITGYPIVGIHVYNGAASVQSLNNNEVTVSPGTGATGATNWFTIGSDSSSGIGGGTASQSKMLLRAIWVFNHLCTLAERLSLLAYYASPLIAGVTTP